MTERWSKRTWRLIQFFRLGGNFTSTLVTTCYLGIYPLQRQELPTSLDFLIMIANKSLPFFHKGFNVPCLIGSFNSMSVGIKLPPQLRLLYANSSHFHINPKSPSREFVNPISKREKYPPSQNKQIQNHALEDWVPSYQIGQTTCTYYPPRRKAAPDREPRDR